MENLEDKMDGMSIALKSSMNAMKFWAVSEVF
jgi:hypothetical protein